MSLPPTPIFSKKSDVLSYESLLSKKFNLILLHWELPFILDYLHYFLLVFCSTFSTVSYLDMLFLTKKNVKDITLSLEWEILTKKLASFGEYLHSNVTILSWKFYHSFSIIVPNISSKFQPIWRFPWLKSNFDAGCWNVFRFFSVHGSLIFRRIFLVSGWFNIFNFSFAWKSMSRCGAPLSLFFWIKLSSIRYKAVYVTRPQFLGAFFESWNLYSSFALKKVTNLKKELCGAPHLDMLFLTKKKIKAVVLTWNEKSSPRKGLFLGLICWISPWNVMILSWNFYHSYSVEASTYSPTFSSFELSWAEIDFWGGGDLNRATCVIFEMMI